MVPTDNVRAGEAAGMRDARRSDRTQSAAALVVLAALALLVLLQVRTDWYRLMEEVETNTLTVAHVLGDHADRLLETADLVRVQAAAILPPDEVPADPRDATVQQFTQLQAFARLSPHIVSIWIGDAAGTAILTSREYPAPALSAADRDYFIAVRDDPGRLFVGTLPDNRYADQVLIMTNRRLPSDDGGFRGFIQVALSPAYLQKTFQRVRFAHDGSLWWLAPDGRPLMRQPYVPIANLDELMPPSFAEIGARTSGTLSGNSHVDGQERTYFFSRSPEYGNTIVIGIPTADLRAQWWARARTTLVFGALLMVALVSLFVVVRRDRRRTLADADRLESEVANRTRELQEAAEQKELLLQELRHRVGNAYATIQALAHQMLRSSDSLDSFRETFPGRLSALAATQSLLVASDDRSAALAELVAAELSPYRDREGTTVEGPPVQLSNQRALAAGLVLHELTTNAVKYGALSVPDGRVTVRWRLEGGALVLDWRERGGPAVDPDGRCGFGNDMMRRAARLSGGSIEIKYPEAGVEARLTVPLGKWPTA